MKKDVVVGLGEIGNPIFKNHNESFFNIIQKRFEWDF
tara:strand:- start:397 stop:507 length:111 start_codon:yes stop_codon:yes gene_type:complete